MKPIRKRAIRYLVICVAALVLACLGGGYLVYSRQQAIARAEAERMAAEQAAAQAAAEQAAAEAAARAAEEEAAREAALEAERQAAAQAAAEQAAADAKEKIEYGDVIGTVWVEGTEVNCDLYWGDGTSIFRSGAGCSVENGCVLPGDNGTVFVGAHTDTFFYNLFDAEVGALIHLDTIYGDFVYKITETKVIYETEVDQCRWGAEEPSCILYTCYPQGIQTPTDRRYLVYADPVETDENGVVPNSLPGLEESEEEMATPTGDESEPAA